MLVYAAAMHDGQLDKRGQPYILHPLAVMQYLDTDDQELQCIALGHDLMEDCGVTAVELVHQGFPLRVIRGIEALTKTEGMLQADYEDRVMSNVDAMRVKLCDIRHNLSLNRLSRNLCNDGRRLQRYYSLYFTLQNKLKEQA